MIMSKANVMRDDRGDGADFLNQQRAIDEAKNERMKSENDENKLDPEQVNRQKNREYKPDVDVKKAGSGKH